MSLLHKDHGYIAVKPFLHFSCRVDRHGFIKLKRNSVPALFDELNAIHMSKRRPYDKWLIDKVSRKMRLAMKKLFKINPPPQQLEL